MKFRTMNSTYHINVETMTWSRKVHDPSSNLLLQDYGPLAEIPEPVVGERCMILEGPKGIHEVIYTSPVVAIDA